MNRPSTPPNSSISQTSPRALPTTDLVHTYLLNCERRGLSPATLKWYGFFLRNFAREYEELPLKPEPIEEFIYSHKTGDERRYGAFRCLRAFYNFIESRVFIEQKLDLDNPFHLILPPRRSPKEKWALNLDELKRLLEYPEHDPIVRTLLYFLADTGIRIGEAVSVTSDNVFSDSVKVKGKTGERIVPISSKVRSMLIKLGPGKLFPHKPHWWSMEISRAFKEVGLPGTAHTLRHTFCTLFEGTDQSLMTITGHKSFQVVQSYTHKKLEKAIKQHAEHGPLARLYGTHDGTFVPSQSEKVDNPTLQTIVELAREVGELRERNNGNGQNKGAIAPHSSTSDYDLANFIGNVRGLPGSTQLANSKFFYHSIVYNFARAIEYKSSSLLKLSGMHAINYFSRIHQVPSNLINFEEPQAIKYISGMVVMIEALFKNLAAEHYQLAMAYQKLAREERDPEWFDFFEREDIEEEEEEN